MLRRTHPVTSDVPTCLGLVYNSAMLPDKVGSPDLEGGPDVLYLSHRNPAREDEGAKIVVMGTLRHLAAKGCRVTLVSLDTGMDGPTRLAPVCRDVHLIPHELPGRAYCLARSLGSGLPYSLFLYRSAEFARLVATLVSRQAFDVVHIESALMYQYAPFVGNAPIVLRHHNIEGRLLLQQALTSTNPVERLVLRWQARLLSEYEKAACHGAAMSIAISEPDRDTILRDYGVSSAVEVIPSGIETPDAVPEDHTEHCLVFSGRMEWRPNAHAAEWFARRVFPALRRDFPKLKFYIVGGTPAKSLRDLAGDGVVVTGFVDSVSRYIDRAEVCVVPLSAGSGMRLKILEAMARGKAIVSTPKGAEGIAYRDGVDIVLANTPDEFVHSVSALLRDPPRRRELGREAFARAKALYSWHAVASRFLECYAIAGATGTEHVASSQTLQ